MDQLLQRTIVSEAAMDAQGLDPQGDPAELVTAENTRYALVEVCDHALSSDSRIDAAWQAQWGAEYSPTAPLSAREMSVHYRSGTGTKAVAELASALTCAGYSAGIDRTAYRLDGNVTLPRIAGADAQLGFCSALAGLTLVECTAVAAHGSFAAALTARAASESVALNAVRKLAPALGAALATVDDPASPSTTPSRTSPPPSVSLTHTAGPWTAAEARQHFLTMAVDSDPASDITAIKNALTYDPTPAEALQDGAYHASSHADRIRIFVANLGAGRWAASAKPAIMRLISAGTEERTAFLTLGNSPDLGAFRTRFTAATHQATVFARAVTAARLALGLPRS